MKQRYAFAKAWIAEMGKYLREATKNPFDFSAKTGHQDIVTAHDKEVEQFFRTNMRNSWFSKKTACPPAILARC